MATKVVSWNSGTGNITLTYDGEGNGTITVTSDSNNLNVARAQSVTVKTTNNAASQTITIRQEYSAAYKDQYLTIKSLADNNTISWRYSGSSISRSISISTDGGITWTSKTSSRSSGSLATLNTGDTLLIRGSNTRYASSTSNYNYFVSSGNFDVYGNVMSLIGGDSFSSLTSFSQTYAFERLFYNCTGLKDASNLILPATTLTDNCYREMFRGCSGLTTAPELPAATLVSNCYYQMFYSCSSLNNIRCLATSISASNCTYQWVYNVASSGTFTKDISMSSWTTGNNGIPTNWTVEDEGQMDISGATVTASTQTYTGSALTPTPTVTLNGQTIPSTGYTVAYSNNTNAGTATITVTGVGNYTGNASGTFTINKANPVYVAPTANNRTYDTTSKALLIAGSSTTPGTFTYCTSQSGTYTTVIPSQTNANLYTTYWKFTPTDTNNYNSVGPSFINTTVSAKIVNNPTITLSQSTYTYNGSACQPTPTVKDGSTTISSGEYTVSYSNNVNAGTGTVIITDKSSGNYTVNGSTTFTINKANSTYTAPVALVPAYSGSAQNLVSAGSTSDGTITYSTSQSGTYSTAIPQGTNAGTYTVWWKLTGDSNHNDVSATQVSGVSIAKANRTISFTTAPETVDIGSTISVAASVSAGAGDGTISFSSGDTSVATVSGSTITGVSAGSITITASVSAGTNYNSAQTGYTLSVLGMLSYKVDPYGTEEVLSVPSGYQMLEYLESSGSQYILTGLTPQSGEICTITFQYTATEATMVMGCRTSSSAGKFVIGSGSSGTYIYASLGSASNTNLMSFDTNQHTVVLDTGTGKASIDGGTEISVGTFSQSGLIICLFAGNQNGTVSYKAKCRIMAARLGTRATFVPCRRISDDELGLYEMVSGTFFTNDGTGSFAAGPDSMSICPLLTIDYGDEIQTDQEFTVRPTKGTVDTNISPYANILSIKGNIVRWNQIANPNDMSSSGPQGLTFVVNADGSISISGTSEAAGAKNFNVADRYAYQGRKILLKVIRKSGSVSDGSKFRFGSEYESSAKAVYGGDGSYLLSVGATNMFLPQIYVDAGVSFTDYSAFFCVIDLTNIYGTGNEPSTVEAFESDYYKWFGRQLPYEEYDAGSIRYCKMTGMKTTGLNPSWESVLSVPVTAIQSAGTVIFPNGMRSAGSVYDEIKLDDGVWKAIKRLGSVKIGDLSWHFMSNQNNFQAVLSGGKPASSGSGIPNLVTAVYTTISASAINNPSGPDKSISIWSGNIRVHDYSFNGDENSFSSTMGNYEIIFELNTPKEYILDAFNV